MLTMTSSDKFRALLAQRPTDAWLLFTDACVDPRSGAVGLGGALFDPQGHPVHTWSQRSPVWTRDSSVAEMLALEVGVHQARERGATRLLAMADCQPAVEAINGNDRSCSKSLDLVQRVRGTLNAFDAWVCVWSPRHRLSVPNDLARAAIGKAPENRQAVAVNDLGPWLEAGTQQDLEQAELQRAFRIGDAVTGLRRPS